VLLRLYRFISSSKIDNDSFIYSSTSKPELSTSAAIRNAGIRPANGAFRTSRLASVYAGSEPLLRFRGGQARGISSPTVLLCGIPPQRTLHVRDKPLSISTYEQKIEPSLHAVLPPPNPITLTD